MPSSRVRSAGFSLEPKSRSNRSSTRTDPRHASSRCLFAVTVLPPLPSGAILIVLRTSRSSRLRLPQRQVSGAFGFSPPLRTARFNALASSQWHCYNGPDAVAALVSGTTGWRQPTLLFATSIVGSCHSIAEKPCPSLPYYPASDLRGGPRLVVELRLWASMQDSGRLRPQSNSTMQAGTANVCILSICGVGALQADRLGYPARSCRCRCKCRCRCQVRRHLAQPDKQFSQSGTNPCIFAKLIIISTTAQMKLVGSTSSFSLRSLLLKSFSFLFGIQVHLRDVHQGQLFVS